MSTVTRKPLRSVVALAGLPLLLAALLSGAASAQKAKSDDSLKSATETAKKIQDATGAKAGAQKVPAGDPCTVVSLSDVRQAFPDAKTGERSRRLEEYGITECAWKSANGRVVLGVQESYSSGTAKDDAAEMAMGFVDPTKAQAARNVRYETITSLGVEATAFVETADPKRFILGDGAMLALRRGDHTVSLMSAELPRRDRAAALKALEDLGKVAAKRLL